MNFIKLTDINGNRLIVELTGCIIEDDTYGHSILTRVDESDSVYIKESFDEIAAMLGL